ncbi:MAG TPA: chitobiase/beta-hexosaminidase C-terminal domain-containing protein [Candidatus Cloacimonadota bacterium]|nr:chitobiase/beta-hexosaminidase C-terminal domain-containing protein [Candidatus Cloacimonadota bacterium]
MVKRTLATLVLLVAAFMVFGQAADLFFSEYVEGSSNNKALEIFNGTGATVDLSQYAVKLGSNGGEWSATNSIVLSGSLANNEVYVIANAGANATILGIADLTSTVTYYNGDDALGLFHGETMIDAIGVYQTDPGTAWDVAGTVGATLNHTLIRKPTVVAGNLNWIAGAGTNLDDSEWVVYAQDYIENLGAHTFNPNAGEQAATPTMNPPAGVYNAPVTVTLSCTTAGATIYYTTNGTAPSNTSTVYSAPIPLSTNTTIKAIAYAPSFEPSYVATAAYLFPLVVSNIGQLRAQEADGTTIYRVSNQVVMTFQQAFRHQKYIQDNTAAILIDDYNGIITSTYAQMDGITGITGTLSRYTTNMLQFVPVADPGAATAHNVNLFIPIVTVAEINNNLETHQSKLVRINDASFGSTGAFASGTNYNVTDATGTIVFRTSFYDADYVVDASAIPSGTIDLNVIVNQFNAIPQITSRSTADFDPPVANDDDVIVPVTSQLTGNYPNPFNPETTISYTVKETSPVTIGVYNLKGQLVKTLINETKASGNHTVVWNGTDENGRAVSSGMYYYKMYAGKYSSTKKMILMK